MHSVFSPFFPDAWCNTKTKRQLSLGCRFFVFVIAPHTLFVQFFFDFLYSLPVNGIMNLVLNLFEKLDRNFCFRIILFLPLEHADAFYVAGFWEEVDWLYGGEGVVFGEDGEVAGVGGWVTADGEYFWHLGCDEGIEELGVAAFAWGIDDGDIDLATFGEVFWEPFFGLGGVEVGLLKAGFFCGFFGVRDGCTNAFYAGEVLVATCYKHTDGAHAAVEVQDCLARDVAEHLLGGTVEDVGFFGVNLEKGGW